MTVKLGVVMDPIANINVKKDTTLAMLLAAQRRGWELYYMEQNNLSLDQGLARGEVRRLSVQDNPEGCYELGSPQDIALSELDVLLMRKDPPFDMDFIYSTYILEAAQRAVAVGGCVSVTIYPGHKEGLDEEVVLLDLAAELPQGRWSVYHTRWLNQRNKRTGRRAPSLLLLQYLHD